MKNTLLAMLLSLLVVATTGGQDVSYSIFSYGYYIPEVKIDNHSLELQRSLYPNLYNNRSLAGDMRWVSNHDSDLVAFWDQQGDTILHILRELSGIEWQESKFDIYLTRYYPTVGSADPLIIPVGGIYDGSQFEAAPEGNRMKLNVIFQCSKRMLLQAYLPEEDHVLSIAYHPLMQVSPYRLDNVAWVLALHTANNILGIDSTEDAYRSAFWRNRMPGREILEKYLLNTWILTPGRPLADWVAAEPRNSELVRATNPPRPVDRGGSQDRKYVENLPLKGRLGITVMINDDNQLEITDLDTYRLAYLSGLQAGDIVRRVNGKLVRTQKEMVQQILSNLETGGATLEIVRDGMRTNVVIQRMEVPYFDGNYLPEFDSLLNDSSSN